MSILENNQLNTALIWGALRNLLDFDEISVHEPFSLVGIQQGTFPIDTYHPIYLEVPRSLKSDISGRSNYNTNSQYYKNKWKTVRIISLPIYREEGELHEETLSEILQLWNDSFIPKEIPSIAIATTINGGYSSEGRIGQYCAILHIWADRTARILELDWFEGPLEDCITPEWYIRTSELMTVENAIIKMRAIHKIPPAWDKTVYSMFTIPNIKVNYKGDRDNVEFGIWGTGIKYIEFDDLQDDLEKIFRKLKEVY